MTFIRIVFFYSKRFRSNNQFECHKPYLGKVYRHVMPYAYQWIITNNTSIRTKHTHNKKNIFGGTNIHTFEQQLVYNMFCYHIVFWKCISPCRYFSIVNTLLLIRNTIYIFQNEGTYKTPHHIVHTFCICIIVLNDTWSQITLSTYRSSKSCIFEIPLSNFKSCMFEFHFQISNVAFFETMFSNIFAFPMFHCPRVRFNAARGAGSAGGWSPSK